MAQFFRSRPETPFHAFASQQGKHLADGEREWRRGMGISWGIRTGVSCSGFLNDRLVYRERLSADEIHAIGKMWKRESMFKTRLETPAVPR